MCSSHVIKNSIKTCFSVLCNIYNNLSNNPFVLTHLGFSFFFLISHTVHFTLLTHFVTRSLYLLISLIPTSSFPPATTCFSSVSMFLFLFSYVCSFNCSNNLTRHLNTISSSIWRRKWLLTPVFLPGKSHR